MINVRFVCLLTCKSEEWLQCAQQGYLYAGAQFSTQCSCGNTFGSYGISTLCNYQCRVNTNTVCGGHMVNSVMYTGIKSETDSFLFGVPCYAWGIPYFVCGRLWVGKYVSRLVSLAVSKESSSQVMGWMSNWAIQWSGGEWVIEFVSKFIYHNCSTRHSLAADKLHFGNRKARIKTIKSSHNDTNILIRKNTYREHQGEDW